MVIDEFNEAFNEDGNLSRILKDIQTATQELNGVTLNVSSAYEKLDSTSKSIQSTSINLNDVSDSIKKVTDNSQLVVEKVQALQTINTKHIDSLIEEFNKSLKGTFMTFDALINEYIVNIENRVSRN